MGEQQRLPSFKPPRDFTLSRVVIPKSNKRVFTPTIPPKRNRDKEKATTSDGDKLADGSSSTAPAVSSTSSDNNRHHGRQKIPPRGRGKGDRRKPDLVQTNSSIFSEGIGQSPSKATRRSAYRGGGSDASGLDTSKTSKRKIKKELDQDIDDKFSLGGIGDFIVGDSEGESSEDDKNFEIDPIILPLANQMEKMTKLKSDEQVIKIKKELIEDGDGQIKTAADQNPPKIKDKDKNSFAQVLTEDLLGPTMAFFQLPDRLPILEQDDVQSDSKEMKLSSTISSLNEGLIGKIQILSDGRSLLYFGDDNAFEISPGISTGFRQDLAEIDSQDTKFSILSQVSKKFILTPDIESILETYNNKPNS